MWWEQWTVHIISNILLHRMIRWGQREWKYACFVLMETKTNTFENALVWSRLIKIRVQSICKSRTLVWLILAQGEVWSKWEPCSKTCGTETQMRTVNRSNIRQNTQAWRDCINNKEIQTGRCHNRLCTDMKLYAAWYCNFLNLLWYSHSQLFHSTRVFPRKQHR